MIIGVLRLEIYIPESNSLKQKRMVLSGIKTRIRNNFNVAVTQIGAEDKWQKSILAVVGVERDGRKMNALLSQVVNFLFRCQQICLISQEMELI